MSLSSTTKCHYNTILRKDNKSKYIHNMCIELQTPIEEMQNQDDRSITEIEVYIRWEKKLKSLKL